MKHLSEHELQWWLDEEIPTSERGRVADHLSDCASCRSHLQELRAGWEEVATALSRLDVEPPAARARQLLARAAREPGAGGGYNVPWLRAAVIVLAFAGFASASVPGSPVRSWIEDIAASDAGRAERTSIVTSELETANPESAGVIAEPKDGRLQVRIRQVAPGTPIRIRLVADGRAAVYALGAADGVHFSTGAGSVEVSADGVAEVRVELPRSLSEVSLHANERPMFSKRGEELRFHATLADSSDAEFLLLVQ